MRGHRSKNAVVVDGGRHYCQDVNRVMETHNAGLAGPAGRIRRLAYRAGGTAFIAGGVVIAAYGTLQPWRRSPSGWLALEAATVSVGLLFTGFAWAFRLRRPGAFS